MSLSASSLIWKQLTPSISNRRIRGESFRYWFLYRKKGLLPVVLFSHGLGGSQNGYKYLRTCWTGRGYATIFLQHPDSDESLLQGVSPSQAVRQLRDAATRKNMELRTDDVTDVLNAMSVWASDR